MKWKIPAPQNTNVKRTPIVYTFDDNILTFFYSVTHVSVFKKRKKTFENLFMLIGKTW